MMTEEKENSATEDAACVVVVLSEYNAVRTELADLLFLHLQRDKLQVDSGAIIATQQGPKETGWVSLRKELDVGQHFSMHRLCKKVVSVVEAGKNVFVSLERGLQLDTERKAFFSALRSSRRPVLISAFHIVLDGGVAARGMLESAWTGYYAAISLRDSVSSTPDVQKPTSPFVYPDILVEGCDMLEVTKVGFPALPNARRPCLFVDADWGVQWQRGKLKRKAFSLIYKWFASHGENEEGIVVVASFIRNDSEPKTCQMLKQAIGAHQKDYLPCACFAAGMAIMDQQDEHTEKEATMTAPQIPLDIRGFFFTCTVLGIDPNLSVVVSEFEIPWVSKIDGLTARKAQQVPSDEHEDVYFASLGEVKENEFSRWASLRDRYAASSNSTKERDQSADLPSKALEYSLGHRVRIHVDPFLVTSSSIGLTGSAHDEHTTAKDTQFVITLATVLDRLGKESTDAGKKYLSAKCLDESTLRLTQFGPLAVASCKVSSSDRKSFHDVSLGVWKGASIAFSWCECDTVVSSSGQNRCRHVATLALQLVMIPASDMKNPSCSTSLGISAGHHVRVDGNVRAHNNYDCGEHIEGADEEGTSRKAWDPVKTSTYTPTPTSITESGLPAFMVQPVKGRKRTGGGGSIVEPPEGKGKRNRAGGELGPNAPKRAITAFFHFCRAAREGVQAELRGERASAVAKVLGEKWRALSEEEKAVYVAAREEDVKRFAVEWEEYTKTEEYSAYAAAAAAATEPTAASSRKRGRSQAAKGDSSKQDGEEQDGDGEGVLTKKDSLWTVDENGRRKCVWDSTIKPRSEMLEDVGDVEKERIHPVPRLATWYSTEAMAAAASGGQLRAASSGGAGFRTVGAETVLPERAASSVSRKSR